MDYGPFFEECPDIAKQEMRQIRILNGEERLPAGTYLLFELFCTDPNCDCRRVFFDVVYAEKRESVAVITYGWEDRDFYVEWFGEDSPTIIDDLKGPSLNKASPQSELAPALLKHVETVLEDEKYTKRIQRHYQLFKESIKADGGHAD